MKVFFSLVFFLGSSISRRYRDGRAHSNLHAASGENMQQELHNDQHAYAGAGAQSKMGRKMFRILAITGVFVEEYCN